MKKIKVLVASVMLFLAASVNVASAQEYEINTQDSIYGLEVGTITNGVITDLSFYSTYNRNEIFTLHIVFYDGLQKIESMGYDCWEGNFPPHYVNVIDINEHIYTINIQNLDIFGQFWYLPQGEKEKLKNISEAKVYFTGHYLPENSSMSIQTSSAWQSNILTFYFDAATSLNETLVDKDITYKYFLLSGIESKEKPAGVPFICVTYEKGKPVNVNKYITIE